MQGALNLNKLEEFLSDIRDEPNWREEANKACDYYDGNQLDSYTLQEMKDRGIAPLIRNLIGPTVDVVLGMEAKNKRDWKVVGDTDEDVDLAEALSVKLKDAERTSEADRATSDAYASQLKAGLGWVEVARESNPFLAPYRVQSVHRNEIFWDWRAKRPDYADGRYLVRKQWKDLDLLELMFPKKKALINKAGKSWPEWDLNYIHEEGMDLARSFEEELKTTIEETEWRDLDRKRLMLYEVWYKVWKNGHVLRLPDNSVIEFDRNNPRHVEVVASGAVKPEAAILPHVRLSWWVGPHRLADIPSPYAHNMFPYVPFWGYKEDRTGIPYGLVRRMISPQDEVNTRLSKMYWLLSAKRVITDEDAVAMSHQEVMDEVARPDAYILLNQHRKNKNSDAFRVESDFQLSNQQFQVLGDAAQAIQDTSGVYQAMLGKDSSAESGIAINNLVEQGATTLAELNDNYRYARKKVGELLLALVKEDMGQQETPVTVDRQNRRHTIVINQQKTDDEGFPYRANDLYATKLAVDLEEVPNTPSYRSQQLQQLSEITKSLPPELQSVIADMWMLSTDLPHRKEMADRIAKATGQAPDPNKMTPEEQQQYQMEQQKQQEAEQVAMDQEKAKLEETLAKAEKLRAEVESIGAKVDNLNAQTDKLENDATIQNESHGMDIMLKDKELRTPIEKPKATGSSTPKKKSGK